MNYTNMRSHFSW